MSPTPPRDPGPASADAKPDPAPWRARSRSPSPRRSPPRKPKNFSGLKWKNDPRNDRDRDREDSRRDDRFSGRRRHDARDDRRERDYDRQDDRRRDDRQDDRRRDPRHHRDSDHGRERERERRPRPGRDQKPAKPAAPAVASTGEAMIIVTVNDRLGTKTQVPCLPSDPVKVLKAMVAAKIGRPVHEIMLKRQGERPFHDSLTLADYSISNGVQVDLELNTGD
ncbi:hypothetical protein ACEQ8H_000658 [Pleosporales sp. CAS-2024a]